MNCVGTPWLLARVARIVSAKRLNSRGINFHLQPDITFGKHTGKIAPPIAACPPQTLLQELWVVFQGGKDFALRVILHVRLVVMRDQPAGQEIVVVSIELVLAEPPLFICEAISEFDVLQDARPIGAGATRQAGHASIYVSRCSTIKIATLQIQCSQEAVDALGESGVLCSSQTLACDYASILLVLEWRQHPLKGSARPRDIVVSKDCDLGGDLGDGSGHLTSLVCVFDRHDTDPVVLECRHLLHGPCCLEHIFVDGNQNHFLGLVLENRRNSSL